MAMTTKVLMSIDLESTPAEKIHSHYNKVRMLASSMGWTLNPVYVESSKEICCSNKDLLENRRKDLKIKMLETVREWDDQRLKDGTVILGCPTQVRSKTELLSRYARDIHSPLIIVFGKGKVGFSRFLMGSFTQELVNESQVPILAINDEASAIKNIKKILFATDFTDSGKTAYEKILDFSSLANASVVLVHHDSEDLKHRVDLNKDSAAPKYDVVSPKEEKEVPTETVDQWVEIAQKYGVDVEFVLKKQGQRVADSIVKAAQEYGCDMIAMGCKTSSLQGQSGSVSQKVVEESKIPVWVLKC